MITELKANVSTFRAYMGTGFLLFIFLIALIYLAFQEKDQKRRILLVYTPEVLLVLFFLPFTRRIFTHFMEEGDTYYRILWLIPMGVMIAYAGVKFFEKHYRIGLVIVSCLVMLGGSLVYKNENVLPAENLYKLPQTVIDIVDLIKPKEGEERIRAAFPAEIVQEVRQYDTNILLPYGREMLVPQWDYYNAVYEAMVKPEVIDAGALVQATRETECAYVILWQDKKVKGSLTDQGLEFVKNIGGFDVYRDPKVL